MGFRVFSGLAGPQRLSHGIFGNFFRGSRPILVVPGNFFVVQAIFSWFKAILPWFKAIFFVVPGWNLGFSGPPGLGLGLQGLRGLGARPGI